MQRRDDGLLLDIEEIDQVTTDLIGTMLNVGIIKTTLAEEVS